MKLSKNLSTQQVELAFQRFDISDDGKVGILQAANKLQNDACSLVFILVSGNGVPLYLTLY